MSNRRKENDFNLDEELRDKIVANEEGRPIHDEHEDSLPLDDTDDVVNSNNSKFEEEEKKYRINPGLKRKDSLRDSDVLLSVRNLKQFFFFGSKFNRAKLKAVSNISFDVHKGECFGIVGESGCGKTTTGRSIIKLYDITSGSIYYKGYRISAGDRWNRKEIKYTKIRLKQNIKKLNAELETSIAAMSKDEVGYADRVNALKADYQEKIAKLQEEANAIISVQQEKIKQIKFDNAHSPRKLLNEIQMIFQD